MIHPSTPHPPHLRRLALHLGLLLAIFLTSAGAAAAMPTAQTKTFHYERYDVDATVNQDGSFDVVETQTLQYTSGLFQGAFRGWDMSRVEDIQNVQVSEDGQPYTPYTDYYNLDSGPLPKAHTFITTQRQGEFQVYWFYPFTSAPDTRTFTIRYHVVGGLRIYPTGDQFYWQAFPPNRANTITQGKITIHLPAGATPQKMAVYPTAGLAEVGASGSTVTFTANNPIQPQDTL